MVVRNATVQRASRLTILHPHVSGLSSGSTFIKFSTTFSRSEVIKERGDQNGRQKRHRPTRQPAHHPPPPCQRVEQRIHLHQVQHHLLHLVAEHDQQRGRHQRRRRQEHQRDRH